MWKSYYVAAKNETTYIAAMLFQIGIDRAGANGPAGQVFA